MYLVERFECQLIEKKNAKFLRISGYRLKTISDFLYSPLKNSKLAWRNFSLYVSDREETVDEILMPIKSIKKWNIKQQEKWDSWETFDSAFFSDFHNSTLQLLWIDKRKVLNVSVKTLCHTDLCVNARKEKVDALIEPVDF